jgi:hypothetical protein
MLFRVPGAKSSPGWPATVTSPGFVGLVLLMTPPCSHEVPSVIRQQAEYITNLHLGRSDSDSDKASDEAATPISRETQTTGRPVHCCISVSNRPNLISVSRNSVHNENSLVRDHCTQTLTLRPTRYCPQTVRPHSNLKALDIKSVAPLSYQPQP